MYARLACAVLAFAPLASHAGSSLAEVICAPSPEMTARLTGQYGETRRGLGLRDPETAMELWSSERGSWTLVMTYAGGLSCIVAMGEDWSETKAKDPA